jgi:hypothetical protein
MVLCSAFFDPDDLIFNPTTVVKKITAKKIATTMIATDPPDPAQGSHIPPSMEAKLGAHAEQRKFSSVLFW